MIVLIDWLIDLGGFESSSVILYFKVKELRSFFISIHVLAKPAASLIFHPSYFQDVLHI